MSLVMFILMSIGIVLILIGMLLIMLSFLTPFKRVEKEPWEPERKVKFGGAFIVGPIPIVFGSDRETLTIVLILAIVLTVLAIIMFLILNGVVVIR